LKYTVQYTLSDENTNSLFMVPRFVCLASYYIRILSLVLSVTAIVLNREFCTLLKFFACSACVFVFACVCVYLFIYINLEIQQPVFY